MIYNDKVYGACEISDALVLDVMQSKEMQRLKGINQYGSSITFPDTNRFEHTMGVYLLLKKFGAEREELIAALLHDIAHTAFSHIGDFLFNRHIEQDFHEDVKKSFVMKSSIPKILLSNGVDAKQILDNDGRFTLMKKPFPDICADRIDYFFRDMLSMGAIDKPFVEETMKSLKTFGNEIVFVNKDAARKFAEKFNLGNTIMWRTPLARLTFWIISTSMRMCMAENLIVEDDLFTTDDEVMRKMKQSKNAEVKKLLSLLTPELEKKVSVVSDNGDFDFRYKTKIRCVDPKILTGIKLLRLSEIDESYKKSIEDFIQRESSGFLVKVEGW